jgi:hypothetical protein
MNARSARKLDSRSAALVDVCSAHSVDALRACRLASLLLRGDRLPQGNARSALAD